MHVSPAWQSTRPVPDPRSSPDSTTGSLVQVGFRASTSADLQIVTADGDQVTLSSDRSTSVGYAAFAATSGRARVEGQALRVSSESSVSLSVEGALDAEELADIRKVVKLLERAASSRDASRLLQRLSRAHLDSLASVEGSIERTVEYSVVRASGTTSPAADAAPPAEAQAPQPSPSSPPLPQAHAVAPDPSGSAPAAPKAEAGDFLFAILASMLRSPSHSRAA
jgi:hypothetical protein